MDYLTKNKLIPVCTHLDIRRARIFLGLRQYEFAKLLHISTAHMSKIENNTAEIKPRLALAVECLLRRKIDSVNSSTNA